MANTFKVKTKASVSHSSLATVYTVPSSTTTVILGLTLANKTTSAITADVQLSSDTSDTETNETVLLLKDVPIPVGSTFELLQGNKIVANAGDIIKVACSVADKVSVTMSYMEQDV